MTAVVDLSGPQLALYDEARQSGNPANYLLKAFDWSSEDRWAVAEALGAACPGCVGRGTGHGCCMCGLPVPEALRSHPDDPSEFPGVTLDGWPFVVARSSFEVAR